MHPAKSGSASLAQPDTAKRDQDIALRRGTVLTISLSQAAHALRSTKVTTIEIAMEASQPILFEKKKNIDLLHPMNSKVTLISQRSRVLVDPSRLERARSKDPHLERRAAGDVPIGIAGRFEIRAIGYGWRDSRNSVRDASTAVGQSLRYEGTSSMRQDH